MHVVHTYAYIQNNMSFARYREEAMHPHATLPALMLEDATTLLESNVICMYLAEVFSDAYQMWAVRRDSVTEWL